MPSAEKSEAIMDSQTEATHSGNTVVMNIADTWSDSQEKLLKSIGERSNCMRWLHAQCNGYFENLNFYFTIPNIVISTLNGSITMSLTSLFPEPSAQQTATTVIGLVSIFSAVLITMNQYVKSQQMTEAHHAAGLAYSKLYRTIMNELSLRRDQRTNGLEFLKHVRTEIDRLESTSPTILPFAIKQFNTQFANRHIEKPEITGDLDEVEINKEPNDTSKGSIDLDSPVADIPSNFQTTNPSKKPEVEVHSTLISKLTSLADNVASAFYPSTKKAQLESEEPDHRPAMSEQSALATQAGLVHTNVVVDMGVSVEQGDMNYTMPTNDTQETDESKSETTTKGSDST
jgi:hypothetical protein